MAMEGTRHRHLVQVIRKTFDHSAMPEKSSSTGVTRGGGLKGLRPRMEDVQGTQNGSVHMLTTALQQQDASVSHCIPTRAVMLIVGDMDALINNICDMDGLGREHPSTAGRIQRYVESGDALTRVTCRLNMEPSRTPGFLGSNLHPHPSRPLIGLKKYSLFSSEKRPAKTCSASNPASRKRHGGRVGRLQIQLAPTLNTLPRPGVRVSRTHVPAVLRQPREGSRRQPSIRPRTYPETLILTTPSPPLSRRLPHVTANGILSRRHGGAGDQSLA